MKSGNYFWTLTLFAICSLLWNQKLCAQDVIKGAIKDKSGLSIPFVNIVVESANPYGTASNTEGRYRLVVRSGESPEVSVRLTCIGYKTRSISLQNLRAQPNQVLEKSTEKLQEVTIRAEEDPAYEMIRKAVKNRPLNDPQSLPSFRYESYNKANIDFERSDSVQSQLEGSGFAQAHFFMFESKTRVTFKNPDKWSEEIVATRMSGIKDPSFGLVSNSFQPFSLYEDYLNITEFRYLNPVSPNSRSRYYFTLEDSLELSGGKTYLISFSPRKNQAENLLKGRLSLSADDFSIVNARYQNAGEHALMYFDIRQTYSLEDTLWFPSESNTLYQFKDPSTEINPVIAKTTYFSEIDLNYEAQKSDFGLSNVSLQEDAGRIAENEWKQLRTETLDSLEENTYLVYDTLPTGAVNTMNWLMSNSASLSKGRLGIGKFDLLLNKLLYYNEYEGFRLGAGLATNEKLIKWMSLESYYAYGFRDKDIKYGGGLRFYLNPKREFELFLSYKNDLEEPGRQRQARSRSYLNSGEIIRNLFTRRMDWVEEYRASFSYRPARGIRLEASLSAEERTAFERYGSDILLPPNQYRSSEIGLEIAISPNEKMMQVKRALIPINISYPNFKLAINRSIPELFNGGQNFTRVQFTAEHQFRIRGVGETRLFGSAGKVWGNGVPESYLMYSRGVQGENDFGILAMGYFQTMGLYQFINDEFVQAGMTHNFGSVFGLKKTFTKPELKIAYQAAIGNLSTANMQELRTPVSKMNQSYLEAGLIIDNILRLKSNVYYSGFGLGVFYRHGPYALPDETENLSFILSFAISL